MELKMFIIYAILSLSIQACYQIQKPTQQAKDVNPDSQIPVNKNQKPFSLNAFDFKMKYSNKSKMHFKGLNDRDTIFLGFSEGRDTIQHLEIAHDLYISKFSNKGFHFILDTYTTPSPCFIKGEAKFTDFNYAIFNDLEGNCQLNFEFFNDTLEVSYLGKCHQKYCGAMANLAGLYILESK